jgi:hypothetical protein
MPCHTSGGYSQVSNRGYPVQCPSQFMWEFVVDKLVVDMKFRVFWNVLTCSQIDVDRRFRGVCCLRHQGDEPALMAETASTSETSVYICLTKRQYIPEHCELHIRRRENVKSHMIVDRFSFHSFTFSQSVAFYRCSVFTHISEDWTKGPRFV